MKRGDFDRDTDVRIHQGRIAEIGRLNPTRDESLIEGHGGVLLPGLVDHHIHLFSLAARMNSVPCGPPEVNNEPELIDTLRSKSAQTGWLRGVGYHESVAGLIDRRWLDKHGPDRPVRIQHRGGRLWIFNSRGLDILRQHGEGDFPLGMDEHLGHLFDEDLWLRSITGSQPPDLTGVSQLLASYGVCAVTDMTPQNDIQTAELFQKQQAEGRLRQHVLMAGNHSPGLADMKDNPAMNALKPGPYKIHLHEAQLPDYEVMCDSIRNSHRDQRAVAVHCVTEVELVFTLSALREAGTIKGDRIEHASIAPPELLSQISSLGVLVVTQPNFVLERGDQYLADIDPRDISSLYRCKSFVESDIRIAGGTDAPFGKPDPWLAIKAAVNRKTFRGRIVNASEALTPEQALELFLGDKETPDKPREIAIGAQADLCLLDRNWQSARRELVSDMVRATWCSGELIYDRVD